jgi:hypothetical protein
MTEPSEELRARLERLAELRDSGVLNEAEYEAARKAAIAEALPAAPAPGKSTPSTDKHATEKPSTGGRGQLLTGLMVAAIVVLVAVVAVVLVTSSGDDSSAPPGAEATPSTPPPEREPLRFSTSCTDDRTCPAIDTLVAQDEGDVIRVDVHYCDRTDGAVQIRTYDFRLYDDRGRATPWVDSETKSQTRACNLITSRLKNNYAPGVYQARVKIFNASTNQESTARSAGFTIG